MNQMEAEEHTIDLTKANRCSFIFLFVGLLVYGFPYWLLWSEDFTIKAFFEILNDLTLNFLLLGALFIFGTIIAGIIIHELLHGLTWGIFAKNRFKSIRFGVFWKVFTPYCHCKEPLTFRNYLKGLLMPGVVLGIFPALAGIIIGELPLMLFGWYFTVSAIGDFMIARLLIKENRNVLIQDHPSEIGFYLYPLKTN